ncbi:hypothetical protein B6V01_002150 [Methanosarcinales archaeon ex4572_44]|nr:MAG: hypothetical protein B6U67_05860 [Methanosarcinales archaeon ex4484_138]PHP45808.1 MAG: hypothetical protein B6V01_002150 [Methanosarcinales archaeon ex4572_44]RLG27827.1 MAG: hypothetical protein DRN70_01485 [Methanosarcinales archaeon]
MDLVDLRGLRNNTKRFKSNCIPLAKQVRLMNLNSKSPFAYMLLILAVIAIIGMGCVDSEKTPEAEETPATTPHETVATTPAETPEETSAPVATPKPTPKPTQAPSVAPSVIQCDLCHINSEDLVPHKEGGKYCDQCHGDQVHPIHVGSGTVNLECQVCHGLPEKLSIPEASGEGHVSCENCHAAPPDSVKPSNGDLIEIHLSRGKYCNTCHGNDVGSIHKSLMSS